MGAVAGRGQIAQEASGVEREGRDKVERAESNVEPKRGAEQVRGGDERVGEERNAGAAAEQQARDQGGHGEVGERTHERERVAGFRLLRIVRVRMKRGSEAADGQEQHGAEPDVKRGGGQGAGCFAYENGEQEQEPKGGAAPAAQAG